MFSGSDLKEESLSGKMRNFFLKKQQLHRQLTLNDDGADEVLNTALVLATDETHVTALTPAGAPGVLDDPVLDTTLLTVTDKKDTVVHGGRRARRIIDTAAVEAPESGINSNGERAVGVESSNHGVLVVVDHAPGGEVILDLALVELASLVNTDIRIIVLADHTDADSIGEGIGHETTVATLIANLLSGARIDHAILLTIDELLLRDKRKLLLGNEGGTLHAASGRESPAGTAVGLILDGSDGTVVDPVLGGRVIGKAIISESVLARDLTDGHGAEVLGSKLLLSHVSELVKSKVTLALTVEVTNKSVVALEGVVAGDVLLSAGVHLVVLDGPVNELVIDVNGESAGDEESDSNKDCLHC